MFEVKKETGEIFIYDEIGPEWAGMIDDGMVIAALDELDGARATVRINSPGGSVDHGVSIFNALERYEGGVDTVNDSVAASISSLIFLAGEKRTIAKNAKVMIHSPWGMAFGTATEFRKLADVLDKYEESITMSYADVMDLDTEEIAALLAAETWYLGEEAVEAGLATEVTGSSTATPAMVAAKRFQNAPKDMIDESLAWPILKVAARKKKPKAPDKPTFPALEAAKRSQSLIGHRVNAILKKQSNDLHN